MRGAIIAKLFHQLYMQKKIVLIQCDNKVEDNNEQGIDNEQGMDNEQGGMDMQNRCLYVAKKQRIHIAAEYTKQTYNYTLPLLVSALKTTNPCKQ